jgi:hypothetical protein
VLGSRLAPTKKCLLAGLSQWPGQDSNLRPTDYESAALTIELPGRGGEATTAPVCVRSGRDVRKGPCWGQIVTSAPDARPDHPPAPSGSLQPTMLIGADQAFGQTLALLATFLGIGVIVNVLIVYIVAQVLAERKQNQEHAERGV